MSSKERCPVIGSIREPLFSADRRSRKSNISSTSNTLSDNPRMLRCTELPSPRICSHGGHCTPSPSISLHSHRHVTHTYTQHSTHSRQSHSNTHRRSLTHAITSRITSRTHSSLTHRSLTHVDHHIHTDRHTPLRGSHSLNSSRVRSRERDLSDEEEE